VSDNIYIPEENQRININDVRDSVNPNDMKIDIIVNTEYGGVPMHIYSPTFSWRELMFPPIKAITVSQGQHSAEISDYEQYNFIVEVSQNMVSMSGPTVDRVEPRKFIVMGKMGSRVDLYIFSVYQGMIKTFQRDIAKWGAELDGSSTSGWKKGAGVHIQT